MIFSIVIFFLLKRYHFLFFMLSIWILFWGLYTWTYNHFLDKKIEFISDYYDKKVEISWVIKRLYKKENNYNSYVVTINLIDSIKNDNINFLIKVSKNYELNENDIILLKTKVDKIDNFSQNFNYEKYLLSKRIYFISNFPEVDIIDKKKVNFLYEKVIIIRNILQAQIKNLYPNDEWAFLSWILIWDATNMSEYLQTNYNNSWLTHLMAVSWFNITIIIVFLWFLFKFLPTFLRFIVISLFIIFFTLIVWDNVAVLRASIMWIIAYFILISWRKSDSFSLVLFVWLILLISNPLYLNYDISFQLSFLAVFGLLFTKDFFENIFKFIPKFFAIRESFVLTLSAMSTTLPIMIFNFWQFSFLSPIANMLVWWVIPFAMLFWILSIIWNLVNEKIWFIIGFFEYFLLRFVNEVAVFFWSLDVFILKFNFWEYSLYLETFYFIILIFTILYFKKEKTSDL